MQTCRYFLDKEALYEKHIEEYQDKHPERIVDQLFEEMAELQHALLKVRRKRKVSRASIHEEIADIEICLDFLKRDLNISPKDEQRMWRLKASKFKQQLAKDIHV